MIIRHIEEGDLDAAMAAVNAIFDNNIRFRKAEYISSSRGGGESWRVTLTVKDSGSPGARRSVGMSPGRRISAACWHCYGVFMDALPEGAVIVAMGKHSRPGDPWVDRNIGSSYYPAMYSDACECGFDIPDRSGW